MSLPFLLAISILVSLAFYTVLAGADYGGGVWDLLASGKNAERQRKTIVEAMGPVWEANHVWLILLVVVLFTAFPPAFARLSIVFHIPLTIALVGIVLRGCAFTFRHYHGHGADHDPNEWEWRWGRLFAIASLITPVVLGTVVGGIYAGRAREDAGFLYGWLGLFPAAVGVFTLSLFAYLAATYLTIESADQPELQEHFRTKTLWSGAVTILTGSTVLLIGREANVLGAHTADAWIWAVQAFTFALALAALLATTKRFYRAALVLVILQVALIMGGWGFQQYPYLIPPDITIYSAAAPHATLRALMVALIAGALVLFPSFYFLFYVFKRSILSPPGPASPQKPSNT
jgi:cytochrome d ubiquinol oxidase subunit II